MKYNLFEKNQGFMELNFSKSFSIPKNETNDNPKIEK